MAASAASLPSLVELMDLSQMSSPAQLAALGLAVLSLLVVMRIVAFLADFMRIKNGLRDIPSAPGGNALLGHVIPMLKCIRDNLGAWDLMMQWMDKKGPIVKYQILGTQGVVVRDPQAMKRIFQTGYKLYEKDLALSYHPFLPILGTGLVTSDGALWQKQRTLMGPALRIEVLDDIISIAHEATARLCEKLEQHKRSGEVVNIEEEYRLLTLQVIGMAVLSMQPEECDRVFPQLYLPVMTEANARVLRPYRKYLPTPEWFRFRSRMQRLNSYLITLFRQRWAEHQAGSRKAARKDILDRIMESIAEAGTKWDSALETQLCYEVKTFLLAGHETSAAMLTWSTFELTKAEDMRKKVYDDAVAAFGPSDGLPPRRAVDDMTYTLAVLKEALRKYSVVPVVTRKLTADDELLGHKIPAGTMIACSLKGTHYLYQGPHEFRPDRYMPGGEYDSFDDSIRAYMFLPFIQGPRNCLGQHLALLEARVVLGLLHKRFRFKLARPETAGVLSPTIIPCGPTEPMDVYVL